MARFDNSNKHMADPVSNYLEGVAKHLVERIYGPDGPAWGTKLTEIEDTLLALRQQLSENMLAEALQRQADAEKPQELTCCPGCGRETQSEPQKPDKSNKQAEPRCLQTRTGEAQWHEPKSYCCKCRQAFFPSE